MRRQIAIIGDSETSHENLVVAEDVGREIAKHDCALVCGGRGGIMEAGCRGAQAEKGITVGVLPSPDRTGGNPYCSIMIPTGLGWTRNSVVALAADGVIIIGGRAGTLSEIAFAWMYNKPIVAMKGSGGWADKLRGACLDDRRTQPIREAVSGKQAVEMLLDWIAQGVH